LFLVKVNSQGIDSTTTGAGTYDTIYIKDNNSVAVSSGDQGVNRCINIINIESKEVMTTISMDTGICILSTDNGGDISATIIWACLFFFLVKVNSQGIDSTTTSPNRRRNS
jgi:hypothetical protein